MNAAAAQATATPLRPTDAFQRYYEEAGPDYAAWSPNFNMHFGFFRRGMNPFDREAMLEEMNLQVLRRLALEPAASPGAPPRVLDLGCGLGATLRAIARRHPSADLHGITLVPWQLEQARLLNASCPEGESVQLSLGHYEHTAYPPACFDAAYAIESSCYAAGANKSAFLREAHRILRPGGRLVVADGFLGPGKLARFQVPILRRLCECWVIDALGAIDAFQEELTRAGFAHVNIERIQARVSPSVLHVPWVTLKFLVTTVMLGKRKMTRARWNNVLAPILLPFVGFPVGPVAYYLVSATRM
jgi:cyclopropane fatty-acyl-phospholipid synthase-like methyltransferase